MTWSLLNDFNNCQSELMAWLYAAEFIIAGIAVGLFLMMLLDKDKGYRQGEIDAINGKIKYEKHENDNKETVWREITDTSHSA